MTGPDNYCACRIQKGQFDVDNRFRQAADISLRKIIFPLILSLVPDLMSQGGQVIHIAVVLPPCLPSALRLIFMYFS